jgi:hypothetical protein
VVRGVRDGVVGLLVAATVGGVGQIALGDEGMVAGGKA